MSEQCEAKLCPFQTSPPLLDTNKSGNVSQVEYPGHPCDEAKCVLWINSPGACAFVVMANSLKNIASSLSSTEAQKPDEA